MTSPLHSRGLCSFFRRCVCQDSLPSLVLQVSKPSFSVLNLCSATACSENWMEPASPAASGYWGWVLEKLRAQLLTVLKMSLCSRFEPHSCFGCLFLQGSFSEHGHTNVDVVSCISTTEQGTPCSVTAPVTLTKSPGTLHKWCQTKQMIDVNDPISCSSLRIV